MKKIIAKSAGETKEFSKKLAETLKPGDVLALVGDLGGGKTTFTKGLVEYFGISEKEVQSPTFTLIKEYKTKNKKIKKIYHLDMYRIQSEKEAEELGLSEIFGDKSAICVIEWADRIKKLLSGNTKWLEFDFIDENTRKIIQK